MLSVIIATKNEEEGISHVINDIGELDLKNLEIIVVDKSSDNTRRIVRELMKKYRNLRLIEQLDNGKANGMRFAVEEARGDIICFLDGDHTYPAGYIPRMLDLLESYDVVVASRILLKEGANDNLHNFLYYRVTPFITKRYFNRFKTSEPLSGMRMLRKTAWNKLDLKQQGFMIEIEMEVQMAKMGMRVAELAIPCISRKGRSKFVWEWGTMKKILDFAKENEKHLENLKVDTYLK